MSKRKPPGAGGKRPLAAKTPIPTKKKRAPDPRFALSDEDLAAIASQPSEVVPHLEPDRKTPFSIENAPIAKRLMTAEDWGPLDVPPLAEGVTGPEKASPKKPGRKKGSPKKASPRKASPKKPGRKG